jgi:hypothetical protein
VGEFVEVESGRRAKRPQLLAASANCKRQKAKLVVAKLDRLTRNVKFMLTLLDSGVEVLFCDMPEVSGAMGRFLLTTMASTAQLEAGSSASVQKLHWPQQRSVAPSSAFRARRSSQQGQSRDYHPDTRRASGSWPALLFAVPSI